jgi:hypothetical protein
MARPRDYETVEELVSVLSEWEQSIQDGEKPTITGLCLALDFASKDTLYNYRDRPEFSYPIKRAILIVENGYEKALRESNATGSIFALKNMGWKDKTETDLTSSDGSMSPKTLDDWYNENR